MSEVQQHSVVYGETRARNRATLKPQYAMHDGLRGYWYCAWPIERGAFAGQFAWTWHGKERGVPDGLDMGWIPSEDLIVLPQPVAHST